MLLEDQASTATVGQHTPHYQLFGIITTQLSTNTHSGRFVHIHILQILLLFMQTQQKDVGKTLKLTVHGDDRNTKINMLLSYCDQIVFIGLISANIRLGV